MIGHRGAAGLAPENTLDSFRLAVELGVPAVELDVYCVDDELIVIHDDDVDRTTNGSGAVADHTLADLRRLDAGDGQQIPTLAEVLEVVPDTVGVNIELKGEHTAEPTAALIADLDRPLLVSSFDHAELASFQRHDPSVPIAPLFGRWRNDALEVALALNAYAVNISQRIANASRVELIKQAGRRVYVYTVNDSEMADNLRSMGANGVFTDYPDRLLAKPIVPDS